MKIHTTNYTNTFIEVAEDCPVQQSQVPPIKGKAKSIANLQYEMISEDPYKYTSDDVIFHCHTLKNGVKESELPKARQDFFPKDKPASVLHR